MKFLEKLQNLSEAKKKIILWSVVIVVGSALFVWWIKNIQKLLQGLPQEELKEQFQLPSPGELREYGE